MQTDEQVDAHLCRENIAWGLDRIDGNDDNGDYSPSNTGCGATVFILDTGIYEQHVEFSGGSAQDGSKVVGHFSTVGNGVRTDPEATNDGDGHGTHCAGTVAGNTYGVAPGANLYAVKVLDNSGFGTIGDVIEGVTQRVPSSASSRCRAAAVGTKLAGR